ncbi:tetratricopeptide repeat protein [bacterium]|nr:tetratricopeptide repeat protein [bacterium]
MRTFPLLIMILILVASVAPASAAAQSPDPRAVSMYNLGLNAFKQGSPESAIIFFKRASDLDPNLADAQYNLGVLYMSQRRYKEASPRFDEVLRIKPNDPDAHFQLGKVYMALGNTTEAKSHLQSIAPSNANFAEAQKLVAKCDQAPGQVTLPTGAQPTQAEPSSQTSTVYAPYQAPGTNPGSIAAATTPRYLPANTAGQQIQQIQQVQPVQQVQQIQQVAATNTAPAPVYEAPVAGQPTAVLANTSVRVIATGFSSPSGLTFDRLGNLYVANYSKNSVDRISRDGTKSEFSAGGHLKGPIGLAADETGNIYVANYNGGTVARITPAGISTVIATGFKKPYYLILDKGQNLFVSQQEDNSIIRISLPR